MEKFFVFYFTDCLKLCVEDTTLNRTTHFMKNLEAFQNNYYKLIETFFTSNIHLTVSWLYIRKTLTVNYNQELFLFLEHIYSLLAFTIVKTGDNLLIVAFISLIMYKKVHIVDVSF